MTMLRLDLHGVRVADDFDTLGWLVIDGVRHKIGSRSIYDALFAEGAPVAFMAEIELIKTGPDLLGEASLIQRTESGEIHLRLRSSLGEDTYYRLGRRDLLKAYGFNVGSIPDCTQRRAPLDAETKDEQENGHRPSGAPSLLFIRTRSNFTESEFVSRFAATFSGLQVLDLMLDHERVHVRAAGKASDGPSIFSFGYMPDHLRSAIHNLHAVDRVNVLYAGRNARDINALLDRLKRPFDLTILDRVTLAPDEAEAFEALAQRADRIIVSSARVASEIASTPTSRAPVVAELPEAHNPRKYRAQPARLYEGENLRVLVMGLGHDQATRAKVNDVVRALQLEDNEFSFYEASQAQDDFLADTGERSPLVRLGALPGSSLNTIVCSLRPHLAWLPSADADPLAFSLLQAMAQGLPALADDNLPYRERLAGRSYSWLSPPNASATELARILRAIKASKMALKIELQSGDVREPHNSRFYSKGYIPFVLAAE